MRQRGSITITPFSPAAGFDWQSGVRKAIYDVMRFWLREGVDGFRVDVNLASDQGRGSFATTRRIGGVFSANRRRTENFNAYSTDHPKCNDVIAEMRRVTMNSLPAC